VSQSRRVTLVLILNLAMIAALVIAGLAAHSLALVSEGAPTSSLTPQPWA